MYALRYTKNCYVQYKTGNDCKTCLVNNWSVKFNRLSSWLITFRVCAHHKIWHGLGMRSFTRIKIWDWRFQNRAQVNVWWITTSSSLGQSTYQCVLCGGRPYSRQYWSLIAAFRVKGYLSLAADGSVQCTRQRSGGCLEEVNFICWMCRIVFTYQWSEQLFSAPIDFSILPIRTQEIPKALF